MNKNNIFYGFFFIGPALCFNACKNKSRPLFSSLSSSQTGINFINKIEDNDTVNILEYLYYYNGGGVALADFNNDGLADIYFTSNQFSNKLYLNKGGFQFEDITARAGVEGKGNWKTGVTLVDINNDGFLDIYVSEVGVFSMLTDDFNRDGKPDCIKGGNFYGVSPFEGRYDASHPNLFLGNGNGTYAMQHGFEQSLDIRGEIRDIKKIRLSGGRFSLIFARNNDKPVFLAY